VGDPLPRPSAWTGFIDLRYNRALIHRDIYVSVDGDRCFLPMPRNLEDLRVAPDYARLIALLSALTLGCGANDYVTYWRRTGLQLGDLAWPRR
jgi:hypothetical protein